MCTRCLIRTEDRGAIRRERLIKAATHGSQQSEDALGGSRARGDQPSPRAIIKRQDNTATPYTTTNSTDQSVVYSYTVQDQSSTVVMGQRGRLRSSSCSSGGSDHGSTPFLCVFCRRNGETSEFYTSHTLKDWRGLIVCPVLRAYTCPKCGATGDYAHTESHCPLSDNQRSLMASLRTKRTSCGIRFRHGHKTH